MTTESPEGDARQLQAPYADAECVGFTSSRVPEHDE
jgi:hypothetical protein